MLRLPPLNALRAFEAAGRHLSFKQAAAELCVTQGAISRHILNLEQYLGAALFNRSHRQVALTVEGLAYLQETRAAFLGISNATARAQSKTGDRKLRIKAPPTCAIRWLVPRLGRYHALFPEIAVQLTTSHDALDFEHDDVDVGIHYGDKVTAGWQSERLFDEVLIPVCSNKLLPRNQRCNSPREIARYVLLHSIRRPSDWRQWLDAAGLKGSRATQELTFENSTMTLQGAFDGLGIAIAQKALVAEDIASGRITVPSEIEVRNSSAYYFVFPAAREKSATVRTFYRWVAEEARATRASVDAL